MHRSLRHDKSLLAGSSQCLQQIGSAPGFWKAWQTNKDVACWATMQLPLRKPKSNSRCINTKAFLLCPAWNNLRSRLDTCNMANIQQTNHQQTDRPADRSANKKPNKTINILQHTHTTKHKPNQRKPNKNHLNYTKRGNSISVRPASSKVPPVFSIRGSSSAAVLNSLPRMLQLWNKKPPVVPGLWLASFQLVGTTV